jgi:hypothetical protein
VRNNVLCSCGSTIVLDTAPFHALDCSSSQWYFKHRHDGVRDTLVQFLKQCSKNDANLYKVYTEPKVIGENEQIVDEGAEDEQNGRMQTIADLRNRDGTVRADIGRYNSLTFCTQYIDVAVVNSAAATYIALENGENFEGIRTGTDWRAATALAIKAQGSGGTAHRENSKKDRYRHLLGARVENWEHFVPFVVEASGRLGPAARNFLDKVLMEARSKKGKQLFLSQLGAIIARNNAMLALTWAKNISPPNTLSF